MTTLKASELYCDATWFARESTVLGRSAWHFVALTDSLRVDDSWIVASVFGEEIFVQSSGGSLRGFRNVCAHRGFPIRSGLRGVGRIECGYHGWIYDRDGVPAGIPRNNELFHLTIEQKCERRLDPVRIESVGRFVFACLGRDSSSLAEFLGPYWSVLASMSDVRGELVHETSREIQANWKLHYEITLDDYHLASVHPTTFGPISTSARGHFHYTRGGAHSSLLKRRDVEWSFDSFFSDCERGAYDFTGYKVHQIFPSLVVTSTREWLHVSRYEALGPTRTRLVNFDVASPEATRTTIDETVDFIQRVDDEDVAAVERHQTSVSAFRREPLFGALETRVAWFRESYLAAMTDDRKA